MEFKNFDEMTEYFEKPVSEQFRMNREAIRKQQQRELLIHTIDTIFKVILCVIGLPILIILLILFSAMKKMD